MHRAARRTVSDLQELRELARLSHRGEPWWVTLFYVVVYLLVLVLLGAPEWAYVLALLVIDRTRRLL